MSSRSLGSIVAGRVSRALPLAIALSAFVAAPAYAGLVDPSPTTLMFPDTPVGIGSPAQGFTLTNPGTAGVTISSIDITGAASGDFSLNTSSFPPPFTLGGGADVTFNATFAPLAPGVRNATLVVTLANNLGVINVPLTGTGLGPKIGVTPSTIAAGGLLLGNQTSTDVTVSNAAGGVLSVRGISLTGPGAAAFTLQGVPNLPAGLSAKQTFTFKVVFNPLAAGSFSATLNVDSDDAKTATVQVPITATAGNPAISLGSTTINFGNARVGTSSMKTPVTVKNTGFSDLHISSVTVDGTNPGDYLLDTTALPMTLAAGATGTLSLQFKPSAIGASAGRLVVASDDLNASMQTIKLSGSGTYAKIALAADTLDFGSQKVLVAAPTKSILITNTGGIDAANVIAVQPTGPQSSWFHVIPGQPLPLRIPAGGQAKIDVTVLPTGIGSGTATIGLMTDDPDVPSLSVMVKAVGVGGTITADPPNGDFGVVGVLGTATKTITLGNAGTDVVTISSLQLTGTNADAFILANPPTVPAMIQPGGTLPLDIAFKPMVSAAYSATISLVTDDPMARSLKIPLDGIGAEGGLSASPSTLGFNMLLVGQVSTPQSVTLTNTGPSPVKVAGLSLSGVNPNQFRFDDPGAFMLDAGKSRVVQVAYAPVSAGAHSAQLVIAATGFVPVQVRLSGVGVSPILQVSKGQMMLDFGNVALGTTSEPAVVGLRNGGQTSFAIESVRSSDPSYIVDTSMMESGTLAPMATTQFTVSFKPAVLGSKAAKIQITLAGGTQPAATVDVEGTGVEAPQPPSTSCAMAGLGKRAGNTPAGVALALFGTVVAAAMRSRRRRSEGRG